MSNEEASIRHHAAFNNLQLSLNETTNKDGNTVKKSENKPCISIFLIHTDMLGLLSHYLIPLCFESGP